MMQSDLIRKYDVPVPRYTSYPTVPVWDGDHFTVDKWWDAVDRIFAETNRSKGISLYIHLPFCESLCTYCACNTRITKNHRVEERYLLSLLKEWSLYRQRFSERPVIREVHLGGGTPTFFSAANLHTLIKGILADADLHSEYEFSFEGHPNNTTEEHLRTLFDLGFRRVSFGVQDLDEKVQRAINRIQPFSNLKYVTELSRSIGYSSISFDLIYGLPWQTVGSVQNTISKVLELRPDRIAFYSYAHVPWIKPGQRGYEDADLPSDVVKRSLYEEGRKMFLAAGYGDIGMDHFALDADPLTKALKEGYLHRNFMGYTTNQTDLLIGLGTSSISDARYAYAQNEKKVESYEGKIASGQSAVFKGHLQTNEDINVRRAILDIACRGRLDLATAGFELDKDQASTLEQMAEEGIITFKGNQINVTVEGRPFIRNIASVFDIRMKRSKPTSAPLFSKAI
jgi:oxygen-independent coproporphyrinogen III oxidase